MPVPTHVAVDGSVPDVPGVLSVPSTAVGDGDGAVGEGDGPAGEGDEPDGDADEPGWLGEVGADAVPDGGTVCVGDPDCGPDGEDDAPWGGEIAGDVDVTTALGDVVTAEIAEGVALACPGNGPSAIGRGWAASTVAPSATSARSAAIGTTPIRPLSGRSSRQFGQKPETGVAS